jgi:integrase
MTDQELFDAFDQYQQGRCLSAATIRRRAVSLRGFAKFMTPRSVTAAAARDVDQWLTRLRSSGTKAAYYRDLVAFYRWATRRELIDRNPMLLTDAPRKPKHLPKPAREEHIATAIAMADGRTQLMILLGALAGLRISEIAAISTEDIFLDREPPILLVRDGKGGKDRVVPLHPRLVERLRGVSYGWLFPSPAPNHEHVNAGTVGRLVGDALTAAGEGGRRQTAHTLRHYFGSEAARWAKGNVILVGGLMGHSTTDTTMGYIAWQPSEGAEEVVARIGSGGRADVPDELARVRRTASA